MYVSADDSVESCEKREKKRKEIIYSVQVKNKTCDGGTEHVFILGSIDCTVANNWYIKRAI